MLYRRVEILESGDSAEPVQFVGVHPLGWEAGIPTAGFVEVDEDALIATGDELAEAVEAIVNGTGDNWHPALREPLVIALCRWREATS